MGIVAIVQATQTSGLPGLTGDLVLTNLLPAAFIFFLARWLAQRLFQRHETRGPSFNLDEGCRASGRIYGALLGLVVAGFHLVRSVSEGARWSEPATNVVIFPLLVLTGLLLWRMSTLLKQHSRAYENDPGVDARVSDRIAGLLSRLLTVVAVAAVVRLRGDAHFQVNTTTMQITKAFPPWVFPCVATAQFPGAPTLRSGGKLGRCGAQPARALPLRARLASGAAPAVARGVPLASPLLGPVPLVRSRQFTRMHGLSGRRALPRRVPLELRREPCLRPCGWRRWCPLP